MTPKKLTGDMATKPLTRYVDVIDKDKRTVTLCPGDTVPAWALDQVTNPACWAPEPEPASDQPVPGG